MDILVREYHSKDRKALERCLSDLLAHLSSLDPLGRVRRPPDFDAVAYVAHLLRQVKKGNGKILVAERGGVIVGCIVGCIIIHSPADLLELYPPVRPDGKIMELVVSPGARGKGVGTLLMEAMEKFFRARKCGVIQVECFGPNRKAHAFYEKQGFADRLHVLLKKLQ